MKVFNHALNWSETIRRQENNPNKSKVETLCVSKVFHDALDAAAAPPPPIYLSRALRGEFRKNPDDLKTFVIRFLKTFPSN